MYHEIGGFSVAGDTFAVMGDQAIYMNGISLYLYRKLTLVHL